MKKITIYLLFIFLLADIGYSFMQHLAKPLDGDMSAGIVPSEDVKSVLNDPFGTTVITENAVYPNPNRYFSHKAMAEYYQSIPFLFQKITDPINSIYLSGAFAKIVIQIILIYLITIYITGEINIFNKKFVVIAAIIIPLFQTNGYYHSMGIIDHSVTYVFFYALPCIFLLIFYYPFYIATQTRTKLKFVFLQIVFLIALMFIITLSGPLNPGVVLIVSLLYLANQFRKNYVHPPLNRFYSAINAIPKAYLYSFIGISILSLYSLYLGTHNSIFIDEHMSVANRFYRIPYGLFMLVRQKIGYRILSIFMLANVIIIFKYFKNDDGREILTLFKWIGLFSLLYILLLPFGGYKSYRPYIIRYDTMIPITILLIFIYGKSVYFLIQNLQSYKKKIYITCVIGISLLFIWADEPRFDNNVCEKNALKTLAASDEEIVSLKSDCRVMSWEKITDPKESELKAQLFFYWNITNKKRLYYQE